MDKRKALLAAGGIGASLALALPPGAAAAGPCDQQISEISRTLSNEPTLGPATSGALAGTAPGAIERDAPMPDPAATSVDPAPSLSEGGKTSGSAGTSEMNAASAQIATSAQDVQLQQQGKPTMAQGGELEGDEERMTQAKMVLEDARALDRQGSEECMAKVDEVKRLMTGG